MFICQAFISGVCVCVYARAGCLSALPRLNLNLGPESQILKYKVCNILQLVQLD